MTLMLLAVCTAYDCSQEPTTTWQKWKFKQACRTPTATTLSPPSPKNGNDKKIDGDRVPIHKASENIKPIILNGGKGSSNTSAIAVCFIGQFPRHGVMTRRVDDVFGVTGGGVSYDAFVATSTQHSETDSHDQVSASALCEMFLDRGFRLCEAKLEPYNAALYVNSTKHLGWKNSLNLYPHRTASYFYTISRCANLVAAYKGSPNVTYNYESVIMTRLDVVDGIQSLQGERKLHWYACRGRSGVLGLKSSSFYYGSKGLIEDRLIVGLTRDMLTLSGLFQFYIDQPKSTKDTSPEITLKHFFLTHHIKMGRNHDYFNLVGAKINREKYEAGFEETLKRHRAPELTTPVNNSTA